MIDLALQFLSELVGVIPELIALLLVFKIVHYFAFGD